MRVRRQKPEPKPDQGPAVVKDVLVVSYEQGGDVLILLAGVKQLAVLDAEGGVAASVSMEGVTGIEVRR